VEPPTLLDDAFMELKVVELSLSMQVEFEF
jgi:hypothetical protein